MSGVSRRCVRVVGEWRAVATKRALTRISEWSYTNPMARPITVPDAEVVSRISDYLAQRKWPATSWSLAEVAPAAGLSPAGLVKRFGSRGGLLRALGEHWIGSIPSEPTTEQPLTELRAFARATFAAPSAHAAMAGIGDLVADLAHGPSAALLAEGFAQQRSYVAALIRALELPRVGDPDAAARILLDALHGGLVRQASGAQVPDAQPSPDETIDYLLELWT